MFSIKNLFRVIENVEIFFNFNVTTFYYLFLSFGNFVKVYGLKTLNMKEPIQQNLLQGVFWKSKDTSQAAGKKINLCFGNTHYNLKYLTFPPQSFFICTVSLVQFSTRLQWLRQFGISPNVKNASPYTFYLQNKYSQKNCFRHYVHE